MIEARTEPEERLCQGDVLRDIDYIERVQTQEGILEVSIVRFPLIIVLTQDLYCP